MPDNNKESCDSVEPKVVSATNDTLTPKERQLMKKRKRFSKYYLNHKKSLEKSKKYRDTHKNKISAYSKEYHVSHSDERLEQFSGYHYSHRDKILKQSDYHYSHHDERKKQFSDYYASHNQKIKDSAREHYAAIKNAKLRQKYRLCRAPRTKHVSPREFKAILKKRNRTYYKKNSKKLKENKRVR